MNSPSSRRRFLQGASLVALPLNAVRVSSAPDSPVPAPAREDRAAWIDMAVKVSAPVLTALARGRLKADMPVETTPGNEAARRTVTHLEALGRTLAGIAPWLDSGDPAAAGPAAFARQALANAVDPDSPDCLSFTAGPQNLVDAAFLALGFLRAPMELWKSLNAATRQRLTEALISTRRFKPGANNWLLFSATIEAFLASTGAAWLPDPVDKAIRAHEDWYKGDGIYGDGADFHWDYYNSYVIQPMLLAVLDALAPVDGRWNADRDPILRRARRFAAVQERLIAPDGSYPPLGRSITYRCGAFHHLAAMALRRELPDGLSPAQVRGALSAVIHRTLTPPGTFDDKGWLRIGLAGHQPSLAESYISTGSLYLCTFAFLPLGLPASDPFWSGPAVPRTSQHLWSGADARADHALTSH